MSNTSILVFVACRMKPERVRPSSEEALTNRPYSSSLNKTTITLFPAAFALAHPLMCFLSIAFFVIDGSPEKRLSFSLGKL